MHTLLQASDGGATGVQLAALCVQAMWRGRQTRRQMLSPLDLDCPVVPLWFFESKAESADNLQALGFAMFELATCSLHL